MKLPLRLGRRETKAVIDAEGDLIALFEKQKDAEAYCSFINNTTTAEQDERIRKFIFEIDWMGTKEFCEYAGFPVPYFQAGKTTQEVAQQFITVDSIRYKKIVEFAKQVKKEKPNEISNILGLTDTSE